TGMGAPPPTPPFPPGASTSPAGSTLNIRGIGGAGGTVSLTNPGGNAFMGAINVTNATLLAGNVSGTATGLAVVGVNAGGRLAGTGTVASEVDLAPGGTLSGTVTVLGTVFAGANCHITPGAAPGVGSIAISDGFVALSMSSS